MEFDRMGKNICSTKSVLFLSLSLFKSLERVFIRRASKIEYGKILSDSVRFFPP